MNLPPCPIAHLTPGMRLAFFTQGCRVNQAETEALRAWALALGCMEVPMEASADLVLINSCAVTEAALRDLRRLVRGLRQSAPGTRIVVAGCAAEVEETSDLDVERLSQRAKRELVAAGRGLLSGVPRHRTRAVVVVQDGCNSACAYCVIPKTRGPSMSRPPAEILAEVAALAEAGVPEITLSAVSARWYAAADGDFWDLVAAVDALVTRRFPGRCRLRLGSLDPMQLSPKALDTLATGQSLCPHLHLSLQSGSPTVLARMGRSPETPELIRGFVEQLARHWPLFGLGVDIITGFPGETEAEWEATARCAESLPLTYAHVFPYSERPGTRAATLPGALPKAERLARAQKLRELVRSIQGERLAAMVGHTASVVLETPTHGRAQTYVPCRTTTPAPPGTTAHGTILAREDNHLVVALS